jgi:hypothetical protein
MKSERRKFRMVLAFAVLFAMLAFINIGCADGTPPEEEWNKTFGGTEYDTANSVQQTSDGGYILAGSTLSYGDDFNMLLVKTDPNGTKQWDRVMVGPKSKKMIKCVHQTSDGGYILAGGISFGGRPWDFLLVKTDSKGGFQWERNIGQAKYDDFANSVQQTSDGGYILAGESNAHGDTASDYDFRLLKTDFEGYPVWDRYIDAGNVEVAKSVQQTSDGGYILVGETYGGGSGDAWLVKTHSNGKVDWSKTFGGTDYDDANSVQQTSDGGYILAGDTRSYGAGGRDFWLVKTDSNGNEQWNKTFGGTDWDWANSVQQTSDGGYILVGETYSYGAGSIDAWLVKTNSNGNEQWNKTFGGTKTDRASSVQQTSDDGYILVGETYSYGAGNADFWLIKVKGEPLELKVISCDVYGDENNDFCPSEGVWVKGNGFSPNTEYKIWIQDDPVNEDDILNTSEDPSELQENATTDATGRFGPIFIWSIPADEPITHHEYDIVVDKQDDEMNTGKYNFASDGIDSATTVGFVAPIPELPTTILLSIGLLALAGCVVLRRKER